MDHATNTKNQDPREPLRAGDTIEVVAPSGPFNEDLYARGIEVIASRGYRVKEAQGLRSVHRYLAGEDAVRARGLNAAFADPNVRAIFAARGGYGSMRLLETIDWQKAAASKKPLIGFSDITALHLALAAHGGTSIHGPVITRLAAEPKDSIERLFALLESSNPPPAIQGRTLTPGTASGPLAGGCMSVLTHLIGTEYFPSLNGCVLLLEDVGEEPYRLDRMWTHLVLAHALDDVAGVVLGEFVGCDAPGASYTAREVLEELVISLGKPALADLPIGHGAKNLAVPFGTRVRIKDGNLDFDKGLF